MKPRWRIWAAGFAVASLYLLPVTGPLVAPRHELVFHDPGPALLLFLPAILDLLLLTGAVGLLLLVARRFPRAEMLACAALLLSLPCSLIHTVYALQNRSVPAGLGWPVTVLTCLCWVGAWILTARSPATAQRALPGAAVLLTLLSLPGLLILLQLGWYGWRTRHLNPPFRPAPAAAALPAAASSPPLLVWIILDELSFDQVYGYRFAGLQLPNFDRLAATATVFTQATPAAEYTRRAVPSLLTGLPLRRTQPSGDGQRLLLYPQGGGKAVWLDPQDTVFGDAQRTGWQAAVTGWYEPYCRLLPRVLDRCFWTYSDELPAGWTAEGSMSQHVLAPFLHFALGALQPLAGRPLLPTEGALDVRRHRGDFAALLKASDQLLLSGQTGLVLIHMPIPHPWGFYDRRSQTFPDHQTSYLDNLALADAYMGHVRTLLEETHRWQSSTVLVMGDHSWRTRDVWAASAHWTPEEQAASHGGQYDPRPAVILKLSGQQAPARVDAPFDAVRTRALLQALMHEQLTTPEQVNRWVRGVAPARGSASTDATHP